VSALLALANQLIDQGKYDEAADAYRRVLRTNKDNPKATVGLERVRRAQAAEREIASIRSRNAVSTNQDSSFQSAGSSPKAAADNDGPPAAARSSGAQDLGPVWCSCTMHYNRGEYPQHFEYVLVRDKIFSYPPLTASNQDSCVPHSKAFIDGYFEMHPDDKTTMAWGGCVARSTEQEAVKAQEEYQSATEANASRFPWKTVNVEWVPAREADNR
jgi:tetratricopeptide (TPR) repeat protein